MNQFLKVTQRVDDIPGNTSMVMDYQDFLSCLYVGAREVKHKPSHGESQDMNTRTIKGMNLAALLLCKVTHRCKDAKE